MDCIEETKQKVIENISQRTDEVIEELSQLWSELYENDIVQQNVRILQDHVNSLYKDITNETVKRKEAVMADVERLQTEAGDLRRLLHVDFDLSHRDGLPLYTYKLQLNDSLESLRAQLKERQDEIEELLVQQNEICKELEEQGRELGYDPLPTAEELGDFRQHLNEMFADRDRRETEFRDLRHAIRDLLEVLELEVLTGDDQKLVHGKKYQLSRGNLNRLRQLREKYKIRVEELKHEIDNVKEKVYQLWKCLDVENDVRNAIERHVDYHRTTYDVWRQEKERCETEKRQNLKKFIDKMRQELLIMWEKTLKSDEEKRRFKYFTSDIYNDDLMRIHEIELEELNQFYNENEKIFELIALRKRYWTSMTALEEKANAPNRFNNRGGQLLREEKERKNIAHQLPKVESELKDLVLDFERINKKKFMIYGKFVEDVIEEEWAKKRAEKHKFQSARKAPVVVTPGRRQPTTPHPSRLAVNSTAKVAPNTTTVSTALKRKLATTTEFTGPAKRNILGDLNSPRPKTPGKMLKPKTIATIHNAVTRRSGSGKKRRSGKKETAIPSARSTQDSVSYDKFEEFMSSNRAHCRSSEIVRPNANNLNKPARTPSRIIKPRNAGTTPYKRSTRIMLKRFSENKEELTAMTKNTSTLAVKSPGASTSRCSPGKLKLSTKDLPIIF